MPLLKESQQLTVTGQVTEGTSGESLPGISVLVRGTTTGTDTYLAGRYSLTAPGRNAVLAKAFSRLWDGIEEILLISII